MKWRKIGNRDGLIFDPKDYQINYAKSPQVLLYDNFIRIYFSFCNLDEGKKYISRVAFIDMDKTFEHILDISFNVIEDGNLGCYDEHGIFPFSPLRYNNRVLAYLSGWSRRVSVSIDTGIGIAESFDNGKTFVRLGSGPILSSSLNEPYLVIDGFCREFDHKFHMWYIYGTLWKIFDSGNKPDRVYKIGHATSNDGIDWVRDGKQIILDKYTYESQALPCVCYHGDKYHMFFCYRRSTDFRTNIKNSYRIGYAYSYDLQNWIRDDEAVGIHISEDGWDSNMLCYPHVFQMDENIYILYNGNDFGKSGFGIAKLEEW